MRALFVPVANRPECARALRTAFDIGKRLDASLIGCHIRQHRYSDVEMPGELGSISSYDEAWDSLWKGKKTKRSSAAALALFAKIAESSGFELIKKPRRQPGAMWMEKVGSPEKVLSIMGPVSDLIVVTRPAQKGGKIARLFMLSALTKSSRPVLILPHNGTTSVGNRITIAWNQSAEAALAVSAAMPILRQAEQVNIVSYGSETSVGPKTGQLAAYLKYWGVNGKRIKAKGRNAESALLRSFKDSKSDLLVMGAYSRSRLRQQILGGVTEHMLSKADIPVLMLHT
jgi:nucleotide-binding universal stress UspA family protein